VSAQGQPATAAAAAAGGGGGAHHGGICAHTDAEAAVGTPQHQPSPRHRRSSDTQPSHIPPLPAD